MTHLNISIFGFKNYIDEVELCDIITHTSESLYDSHMDGVMIHFIKGSDKSDIIERICITNGFGYIQYHPEWNRTKLERWELSKEIRSKRTGKYYNLCAPLNMNRKILKLSDYVLLLNDINIPNTSYIDFDEDLRIIHKIIKYDNIIKDDHVANVNFNSSYMTRTAFIDNIQTEYSHIPF